jgi:molecular chaperone GrpE
MQSNKPKKKEKQDDISIEILSDFDEEELAKAAEEEEQKKEQAAVQEAYDAAFSALEAQVENLKKENFDLKDQMLRKAAEFDNFRKRSERERSEAYKRARKDVLLDLLPVLDNFERAMASMSDSMENDAFTQGVELIYKQFQDLLKRLGVEPIDAVGKTFDPHLHEAVMMEPSDEHEVNTVITEFQKGYTLGDQLLRPAQVKVAAPA